MNRFITLLASIFLLTSLTAEARAQDGRELGLRSLNDNSALKQEITGSFNKIEKTVKKLNTAKQMIENPEKPQISLREVFKLIVEEETAKLITIIENYYDKKEEDKIARANLCFILFGGLGALTTWALLSIASNTP